MKQSEIADESTRSAFAAEFTADEKVEESYSGQVSTPLGEQKLIRTAHLGIEVAVYEKSRHQIDSIVKLHNAWISSENLNNYEYRISNSLAIRVPSDNLDALLNDLLTIAKKVDFQNVETADVTEEFIDVESRLKNQKAVEQKFVGLLRRTDSIDEILKIETKLAEIRGEIESFEGRLKYLKNRVSYSTVNLNLYQKIDFKFVPEPMESFWERLKNSLDNGWKGFVAFLLFFIRLWPLWIIAGAVWFFIVWFRKMKTKKPTKEKKRIKNKDRKKEKKDAKPDASLSFDEKL